MKSGFVRKTKPLDAHTRCPKGHVNSAGLSVSVAKIGIPIKAHKGVGCTGIIRDPITVLGLVIMDHVFVHHVTCHRDLLSAVLPAGFVLLALILELQSAKVNGCFVDIPALSAEKFCVSRTKIDSFL